ncbi:hypothetical protein [Sulfitobacter sp.]|jgi:hypothetical protein
MLLSYFQKAVSQSHVWEISFTALIFHSNKTGEGHAILRLAVVGQMNLIVAENTSDAVNPQKPMPQRYSSAAEKQGANARLPGGLFAAVETQASPRIPKFQP